MKSYSLIRLMMGAGLGLPSVNDERQPRQRVSESTRAAATAPHASTACGPAPATAHHVTSPAHIQPYLRAHAR